MASNYEKSVHLYKENITVSTLTLPIRTNKRLILLMTEKSFIYKKA